MDNRRKKLLFRSQHRGTLENDILIGEFASTHLEDMSETQLDTFEQLIEQSDVDLYRWITGDIAAPEKFETDVLEMLRNYYVQRQSSRSA